MVPEPYEAPDASGPLTDQETAHLAACETALDVLRIAFGKAGKALQVVTRLNELPAPPSAAPAPREIPQCATHPNATRRTGGECAGCWSDKFNED